MKKILAFALVLIMALTAFGCGTKPATTPDEGTTTPDAVTTPDKGTTTPDEGTTTPDAGTTTPADTSLEDLKARGKLIQGLDDAFPPMGYRDENNEIIGFDVDLATEVAARLGVELELMPIDWSMKEQELELGNIDVIWNGYTITEERIEKTEMTFPYMKNRQVMVVKEDSAFQTLADLEGKKIALQAESSAAEALASNPDFMAKIDGGKAIEFTDNMKALMDLDVDGCDAVLMDEVVANFYITQGSKYRVLDESLADEEYGIGCKKGSVTLHDEIEKILTEMAQDGTLAKISTTWFGKDVTVVAK